MLLLKNEIQKLLESEWLSNIRGLFYEYHDRYLVDDSLSDIEVVLLSIAIIESVNKSSGAERNKCRELFEFLGRKGDNFRTALSRSKEKKLITEENERLTFLVTGLKKLNKILSGVQKASVYVVKSGEFFSAIILFEEFLKKEIKGKEILLCDPYISHSTLQPFSVLSGKLSSIKILTSNIHDHDKFEEYKKRFEKQYEISVEVKTNKKIHDRYLISENKCWSIGTSINSLGNKDTIIKDISEVTDTLKELFLERWNE